MVAVEIYTLLRKGVKHEKNEKPTFRSHVDGSGLRRMANVAYSL